MLSKRDAVFSLRFVVLTIVTLLLLCYGYYDLHGRTEEIECDLGLGDCSILKPIFVEYDALAGFVEECYEYEDIIVYNFTVIYVEVNSPNMEAELSFITESFEHNAYIDYPFHYQYDGITYIDSFPKEFKYEIIGNKIICSKYHLVKKDD